MEGLIADSNTVKLERDRARQEVANKEAQRQHALARQSQLANEKKAIMQARFDSYMEYERTLDKISYEELRRATEDADL